VHGLTPRHRRKTGSGPPASALIAWISADPYLRSAVAAAASHRRHTDSPANTRVARATITTCFVLVCSLVGSAVLNVTAAVNDGLPVSRTSDPSLVLDQHNAAAPDPGAPSMRSKEGWPISCSDHPGTSRGDPGMSQRPPLPGKSTFGQRSTSGRESLAADGPPSRLGTPPGPGRVCAPGPRSSRQ
jgi:hypothetical protein